MELDEILDLCKQMGNLTITIQYQNEEIKKWRDRYLASKGITKKNERGPNVRSCFLAVPSQIICEAGEDAVFNRVVEEFERKGP